MKVVLLAAGFATRLYPLTKDRAKPLLEVGGRPVIDHVLDRLLPLEEVREIVVVTNARFHDDFRRWREGRTFALPLRLVNDGARRNEERLGGVADMALGIDAAPCKDDGKGGDDDDVLVAAGDNLLAFGLGDFVAEFRRRRRPLLLARRFPGRVPPGRHGEVVTDSEGRITRFREKPPDPHTDLVSSCLYAFPPGVRGLLGRYLADGGNSDAPGHFMAWLCAKTAVHAHVTEGRIFDIGDAATLEEARRSFRPWR